MAAWVAAPLLDAPLDRAEVLLEELVDEQLVDVAGWDATGRPRYRLHDLLHAYAREYAHAEEPAAQRQAIWSAPWAPGSPAPNKPSADCRSAAYRRATAVYRAGGRSRR